MSHEPNPSVPEIPADLRTFPELARFVRDAGFFEKTTGRILLELLLHVTHCLGGLAILVLADAWWLQAVGYVVSTLGALGIATNTHTSSHNVTGGRRLSRFLTYFGYTFFFGTSATYWWNKHCVVHHPTPNLVGVDDDIDLLPWFALNEEEHRSGTRLQRAFFRVQWLVIPFALAFNEFNIQVSGWRYLLPILADRDRRRAAHWIDLGVLGLHWAIWVVIPLWFFAPPAVIGLYVLRMMGMGYAMFAAFAPAHFPAEAIFAEDDQRSADFVLRQTTTTVNFRTGLIGRLLCSGVEYQIEHHLFPQVSHVHYPRLSRVIESYCVQNGYPYRTLGWGEAIWKSLLVFRRPKPIASELPTARGL